MPTNQTQPSPPAKTPIPKLSRKLIYGLSGIVVLAAILGAGAYVWHHSISPPSKATEKGAYPFSYIKFDSFTLKGTDAGGGVVLSKPAAYSLLYESPGHDQASFRHAIVKSYVHATIGGIDLASLNTSAPISSQELKLLNDAFAAPTKTDYKSEVASIQKFVTDHIGPLYTVKLSPATSFQSTNIHTNAWAWDLTATPIVLAPTAPQDSTTPYDASKATSLPKTSVPGQEPYKGQVIFAAGKHAYYYFLIFNTTYNWDNNTAIWTQTTNSLKIDQ